MGDSVKIAYSDGNMIVGLTNIIHDIDSQPPVSPNHGGLFRLGDTPRPLPERILDFLLNNIGNN
jgi:hypothetical protein